MALPNSGGGYQYTDGNTNEIVMGVQPAPQTATVTATLTAAQITGGILVGARGRVRIAGGRRWPGRQAAARRLPCRAADRAGAGLGSCAGAGRGPGQAVA